MKMSHLTSIMWCIHESLSFDDGLLIQKAFRNAKSVSELSFKPPGMFFRAVFNTVSRSLIICSARP